MFLVIIEVDRFNKLEVEFNRLTNNLTRINISSINDRSYSLI